jgi:hypothetical protein
LSRSPGSWRAELGGRAGSVEPSGYKWRVTDLAIRIPSVDAIFDPWSVEPLARRPLSDEGRERIVDAWTQVRKRASGPPTLTLRLSETERRPELDAIIAAAVRSDMETMAVDARRHWFRDSLRPRESRIGIVLFVLALAISGLLSYAGEGDSILAQTFVVMAWVALWGPAYRVITAASLRLGRRYFAELAVAEVKVVWDEG